MSSVLSYNFLLQNSTLSYFNPTLGNAAIFITAVLNKGYNGITNALLSTDMTIPRMYLAVPLEIFLENFSKEIHDVTYLGNYIYICLLL